MFVGSCLCVLFLICFVVVLVSPDLESCIFICSQNRNGGSDLIFGWRFCKHEGGSFADDLVVVQSDRHMCDGLSQICHLHSSPEVPCHLSWWLQSYLIKVNVMSGLWMIEVGIEPCLWIILHLCRWAGLILCPFCGDSHCLKGQHVGGQGIYLHVVNSRVINNDVFV